MSCILTWIASGGWGDPPSDSSPDRRDCRNGKKVLGRSCNLCFLDLSCMSAVFGGVVLWVIARQAQFVRSASSCCSSVSDKARPLWGSGDKISKSLALGGHV